MSSKIVAIREPIQLNQFERANMPAVYPYKVKDEVWYLLQTSYYPQTSLKASCLRKKKYGFKCEADAVAAAYDFRVELEIMSTSNSDRKRVWLGKASDKYSMYALNSETILSAAAKSKYIAQKRTHSEMELPTLSRVDFKLVWSTEHGRKKLERVLRFGRLIYMKKAKAALAARKSRNTYYRSTFITKSAENRLNYLENERLVDLNTRIKVLSMQLENFDAKTKEGPLSMSSLIYRADIIVTTDNINDELQENSNQAINEVSSDNDTDMSMAQLDKIYHQAIAMSFMMEEQIQAYTYERDIICESLNHLKLESPFSSEFKARMSELGDKLDECDTTEDLAERALSKLKNLRYHTSWTSKLSVPIIRRWWSSLKNADFKGIPESVKVAAKRESFLEAYGLLTSFKMFMKTASIVTVDSTRNHLTKILTGMCADRNLQLGEILEEYHLSMPISRTTVWRWMRMHGAKFDVVKKSYYTDTHDTPDNIAYRMNYIATLEELSKRMPLW